MFTTSRLLGKVHNYKVQLTTSYFVGLKLLIITSASEPAILGAFWSDTWIKINVVVDKYRVAQ